MSAIAPLPSITRGSLSASMSLDELLEDMRRYGLPSISMIFKDGWYASVNMHTNEKGTEFKVKSEVRHPRPIDAARECHDRMHAALKTLAAGAEG